MASSALSSSSSEARAPKPPSRLTMAFVVVVLMFCIVSAAINMLHATSVKDHHTTKNMDIAVARAMADFVQGYRKKPRSDTAEDDKASSSLKEQPPSSKLAGLNCDAYGGPPAEIADEMVYWSDVPSDAEYVSPFHAARGQHRRYMTFEPDGGGWNNIRMAMETVVGLAVAMGRTLVLPPEQRMYLLRNDMDKQKTHFGFADFFPFEQVAKEHKGLDIITMQEFLEAEAMTGNLIDRNTNKASFPPGNRTNWDGQDGDSIKTLKEWLRNITHTPLWSPGHCLAAFPQSTTKHDMFYLKTMQNDLHKAGIHADSFVSKPVPVDGIAADRMHENMAGRKDLCVYDTTMQQELVLHFMCYHKMRIRFLVHFYAFLFFEDWKVDLWMKRFIRDHVRYIDEIQCAAARVVHAVRERSRQRNPDGKGGFDSFHIRRGDFQFKTTRISAEDIYSNSHEWLTENKTVYIATDERKKSFFDPIKAHYDIVFLNDFKDILEGVNTNYYGMIDQLVASRGDVFVGCWFSTFTGYINRIRGYHSVKSQLPGYKEGALPTTYYYATIDKAYEMHKYIPLRGGFFSREFPTSWRDIDQGIGQLPTSYSLQT